MFDDLVHSRKPGRGIYDLRIFVIQQPNQQIAVVAQWKRLAPRRRDRFLGPACRSIDPVGVDLKSAHMRMPAQLDE